MLQLKYMNKHITCIDAAISYKMYLHMASQVNVIFLF